MKPIICFGEALIDFLHTGETQQDLLTLPMFRQYPGGAPANAAVAIAKLGGEAFFAGQVGDDVFGNFLSQALASYGVDVTLLSKHSHAKTALAFVSLDETGERSFSFYRDKTADIQFDKSQVQDYWFDKSPIVHFCSNTLTQKDIALCTRYFVEKARQNQCIVSFDVNLRHDLWDSGFADISLVNELVKQADVLKFSKDEFDYLSENNQKSYLANCFDHCGKLIVVTDGANPIQYFTANECDTLAPPDIEVVDTTAGGDAFIGGLLYMLSVSDNAIKMIDQTSYRQSILNFAAACGATAVSRPGAFPALPNLDNVLNILKNKDTNYIERLISGEPDELP